MVIIWRDNSLPEDVKEGVGTSEKMVATIKVISRTT